MTNQAPALQQIPKYRKLIGLTKESDLSALKSKYAELQSRFNQQISSDDPAQVKKGQNNLTLLDQAYAVLAKDIRARQAESQQQASKAAASGATRISIELCTMRIGFQVIEGSMFALETKKVSVNFFGFRSTRTNNRISTNWPSGKLTIFNDHLKLKCLLGSYEIAFSDVVNVTKVWYMPFNLVFRQKSDEDMIIYVFGFGLGKKLKELNAQFTTRLQMDY